MSNEFDYLVDKGRKVSQGVQLEQEESRGVEQIDLDAEATKSAVMIVGAIDSGVHYVWPFVVYEDAVLDEGVEKITPITRKYGGGVMPEWMMALINLKEKYEAEFMAGVWAAGFVKDIRRQIIEEEQRLAQESENDEEKNNIDEGQSHA